MLDRIMVIGLIIFSAVVLAYTDFGNQAKVYNCSLAEIHPDYPKQVKEECRRLIEEYHRHEDKKESIIYI